MAWLISIDPGKTPGIAVFKDGVLVDCGIDTSQTPYAPSGPDFQCVCEIPQVYRIGKGKGDPNDLVMVAACAGRMTALFPNPSFVKPERWKAQVDGDIMCDRIVKFLTPGEASKIPNYPDSYRHNVIDAIGIGLWKLGRMGRGGTPV
jgi:hypothetical protein